MADFVFNIAKGAVAEKLRDAATSLGILLLKTAGTDAALKDLDTVAAIEAEASTAEATDASYARKTGITATVTVDDTNDRVDVDCPDQTWAALDGDPITDAIFFCEESAADSGRVPLTLQDFVVDPDGTDVVMELNSAGFFRAS